MGIFFTNGPESEGRGGRRLKATFMLGVLVFVLAASTFAGPKPAKAFPTEDVVTETQTTVVNVWTQIKDAFVEAAVTAVVNGVNYFASQMAYTLAVALTSDCPGQIVCWNSKAFEDGFKQAWQGAIGEAVGTLSQQGGFAKLGFDLCNPSINFALKIQLGALDEIKPPPPKCDFGAIVNNWSNFKDSVSSGEVLKGLKPTFEKGQSGLSIALGAQSGLYEVKEEAKRADIMKRIMDASAGGGFSDVRDPVSGRAKAPSSVVHEQFQQMRKDQERGIDTSATTAAGQIASKAIISVVINAVQTFAMTLISRLLNKLINGLMSTEELIALQPDLILNPEGLLQPPGATGAAEVFATRFSAAQPRDAGVIDPLLEFSVCPGNSRGPNNCVIDQQFANAIRAADVTPLTVKAAMEKNMLHGDWPLYPASNQLKDQDPFCYTYGYCESNLKKLRAVRAIPIGWEVAAAKAGSNTTLREIVNGFNNCNEQGIGDAAHPWCHLIDPDWVLKVPPTQCRALAFGAVPLSSNIPQRAEQCVDTQTCLKQDDTGSCVGGWGYCARERNVWRFNADSCPGAYNTCRTLKSRTGEVKNYLLNTIDHGVCNADNAGCRQYGLNLSTVTCSRASDCSDPAGCPCSVTLGDVDHDNVTCKIDRDKTSCTAADGTVCRQSYPCSSASCNCTSTITCRVAEHQRSCSALTGDSPTGDDWQLEPSRFFNKNAQTCSATDNGCSSLVKLDAGQSLNLVQNGSFEESEDGDNSGSPDHATFWTPFAGQPSGTAGYIRRSGDRSVSGSAAVLLPTSVATTTCTVPAGTDVDPSTGNCTADLGCPCSVVPAGTLHEYTCKVVKGHQKCFITNAVTQDGLPVSRGTTYTLSATFIPDSGTTVHGRMSLVFRDANGVALNSKPFAADHLQLADVVSTVDITGGQASCQGGSNPGTACTSDSQCTGGGTCPVSCAVSGGDLVFSVTGDKDDLAKGLRAACTFVISNKDVQHAMLSLSATSGTLYADDVQFEEGGGTVYHDGYGIATPTPTNLKVPPAFLGCTGDEGDRPECDSFAGVCRETEVGCDGYSPDDGDPTIPGIVGPRDRCPQECAGYDIFKQEETDFDATKFPVYFIPSSAQLCTQGDVGCSEFTSVETEKVEYYSRLRLCVKPDDPSVGTYYSWEGSDTTGYQLRVWSLKNTSGPVAGGTVNDVCATGGCTDAGPAPCTSLDSGAVNCDSKTQANPTGEMDGLCDRVAIDSGDFDCREFYDAAGNRHYRRLTKTIIASAACTQYRITVSTQPDCTKSNGRWDDAKGQCIYFADAGQSRVCSKPQNNCRAYKGNAATNVHSLLVDDFETGLTGWNDSTDAGTAHLTQSSEAVTVGGHSLKIGGTDIPRDARKEVGGMVAPGRSYTLTFWARGVGQVKADFRDGTLDTVCTLTEACASDLGCGCSTVTGFSCLVGNGATTCSIPKATGKCNGGTTPGAACSLPTNSVGYTNCVNNGGTCSLATPEPAAPRSTHFSDDNDATSAPRVAVSSEWKQYSLGPVIVDAPANVGTTPWGGASVKLQLEATGVCVGGPTPGASCTGATCGAGGSCAQADVFIDNVNVKEVQDSIYVIRDSWVTPATCDQTPDGIPSPQEMLGCRKYRKSTDRTDAYVKSFTSLCRDKAIGCSAFSSTQNTPRNPYEESFNAACRLYDNYPPFGVLPRKCGVLTCKQATACDDVGGCSCSRDSKSCTILKGGTSCEIPIPADSGASCVCDYDLRNPAVTDSTAPQLLSDVCRVSIGSTDCRFKLDRWDDSTRPDEHPDRVNVPADKRTYLVASDEVQCSAEAVGCRAMGLPHMNFEDTCTLPNITDVGLHITTGTCVAAAGCTCTLNSATCNVTQGEKQCKVAYELGIVDKWGAVALKDDPAKYEQNLCTTQTLNCESYTASDGTYYFKNPVDKVCEFKENVLVNGHSVTGFFRKSSTGANFPCYPEFLKDGTFYAMYKNADPICTLPNINTFAPYSTTNPKITGGKCQDDSGCLCAVAPNPVPVCRVFKGNTTCGYQGWVGQCEAKYDRCEEFLDPAATSAAHPDGEPYYYIVNAKLDLKTCAGKASLKSGCVLLKQTSKTENIYSAAATYYRSLAEANSGLVSPVNCDVNPRSSACEQRCLSIPKGKCSENEDATCVQDTDDPVLGCPGATNHCIGQKRYGAGCNGANGNKDCSVSIGEVCARVKHCSVTTNVFCEADSDCPGPHPGSDNCVEPTGASSSQVLIPKSESKVTKNDSNIIVKVRPDRQCAEWFACKTFEQVFDPQKGKNTPRCTAFTLCSGTDNPSANSLECSSAVEPAKQVFGEQDYMKRDVTYNGLEYSGYTIPARYPAQYLSPVAITTGRCYPNDGTAPGPYQGCKSTSDCGGTEYCKALAGICRGDLLDRSCDHDDECGNGFCSQSFFDTHRFAVLLDVSYTCANDNECDGLDDATPAEVTAALGASTPDAIYAATNHHSRTKFKDDGACLQHRCYYNYSGGPFNPHDTSEKAQCRAYPEGDAPYTDTIVDKLQGFGQNGFDPITWQATAKKPGFQGVNTCTYKNDCECSYKRLEFGRGGQAVRFVANSGGLLPNSTVVVDGLAQAQSAATGGLGVCSGGSRDGWTCSDVTDCTVEGSEPLDTGTCTKLSRVSTVLGWPGFCIDYDKSININGDQSQFNCNVWLPVDQLAGAPDTFNQFREAGYKPTMDSLLYCAVAEGNRHGGVYDMVLDDSADPLISPCKGGTVCQTHNGDPTGCANEKNNVGSPWDLAGLGMSNSSACWYDSGTCRNRVQAGVFPELKTNDGSPAPPVYPPILSMFGYPSWNSLDACVKAGILYGDTVCLTATIAIAGINAATLLMGPAVAGTCMGAFMAWCDVSGFKSCDSDLTALAGGGEFFHTSWQDATAATHAIGANIKKDQILAAVIEFQAGVTSNGLMRRLFLTPNNNFTADLRFPGNCDDGLCDYPSDGNAYGVSGNDGVCLDLLQRSSQGQGIEGQCEAIESISPHNCVGARIEWTGDTANIIRTVLCHNDSTVWHRVSARVVFLFKEACTEVIQEHDASNDATPNFAWTNRLWQAQKNIADIPGFPGSMDYSVTTTRPGANPDVLEPYGPITPSMAGDAIKSLAWPIPPYPPGGGGKYTGVRFGGASAGKSPPCADSQDSDSGGYDPSASAVYTTYCDSGYTTVAGDPGSPAKDPGDPTFPVGSSQHMTAAGYPYACIGDCAGPNPNQGSNAESVARGLLSKMFAQSFSKFIYSPGTINPAYVEQGIGYDDRQLYAHYLDQPIIVAPNTGSCDQGNEGLCTENAWDAAHNGSFEVSGIEESATSDVNDVQTATGGRATAYFKYYAYANSDHMPLRRKMVDFGDGSTPAVSWGWFKNHRGCKLTGICSTSNEFCGSDPNDWGLQAQACESRYFQDVHTYTCTPQLLVTLPECTGNTTFPCQDGTACLFKPRIQFLDNWGICNGKCPGGVGAADLCFNSDNDLNLKIPTTDPTTGPGRNECMMLQSTGVTDDYHVTVGSDIIAPWTLGPTIRIEP